jgi:hypothetical protein
LFSDVLPANHKVPRDMYQSKKLLSGLGMDYEKLMLAKIIACSSGMSI